MKITLGGVRGTGPVAGRDFLKFGGDTTSLMVRGGKKGATLLLDAGTGIRKLGVELEGRDGASRSVLLLMTHYHLDHMMGLPSLPMLYSQDWEITMAAPLREGVSVRDATNRLLSKPFWPVQLNQLQANIQFLTLKKPESFSPFEYQGLEIRWCPVRHPEGCTAFRVDDPAGGRSFVLATDLEWSEASKDEKEAFMRLCCEPGPADLLLFDGQFTASEYPRFRGWGHSSWQEAVRVAESTGVRRLQIIHHAPSRADRQLMELQRRLREKSQHALFAAGGVEIEL